MDQLRSRASTVAHIDPASFARSPHLLRGRDDPQGSRRAAVTRGHAGGVRTGSSPTTVRHAAVQLRQLVHDVDEGCGGDVPAELMGPLLRVVDELSAATSNSAVHHSDPTSASWVLVQRAADHFRRRFAHHVSDELVATVSLRLALAHARDVAAAGAIAPESIGPIDPPSSTRLLAVVTPTGLGRMRRAIQRTAGDQSGAWRVTDAVVIGAPSSVMPAAMLAAASVEARLTDAHSATWWVTERAAATVADELSDLTDTVSTHVVPRQLLVAEVQRVLQRPDSVDATLALASTGTSVTDWWMLRRVRRASHHLGGVQVLRC